MYITLDIPVDMMFNDNSMACTVKSTSTSAVATSGDNNCTIVIEDSSDNFGSMI